MKQVQKDVQKFFEQFPQVSFQKGQALISPEKPPTTVYYLEEGLVRMYWISKKGDEVTLNLFKPHAFLPMSWAIANITNQYCYESITPVKARVAGKTAFLAFTQQHPEVIFDLTKRIYIGLEGLFAQITELTTGNAERKIAQTILILAKRFGQKADNGLVIQLKMTEKDLATYTGMTRETTNRELQRLKKLGLILIEKGKIHVLDLANLEKQLSS